MLKLAALESTKNLDLEKKEGRIDDLLRVRRKLHNFVLSWQAGLICIVTLLRSNVDKSFLGLF